MRRTFELMSDELANSTTSTIENDIFSLSATEFDITRINPMLMEDLQWIYSKGLTCGLVDQEHRIEDLEDELAAARSEYAIRKAEVFDDRSNLRFMWWVKTQQDKADTLEDLKRRLDSYAPYGDNLKEPYNPQLYSKAQLYVDRFSMSDLPVLADILDSSFAAGKIKYKTYVLLAYEVTHRLASNTRQSAGWWDACDNIKKMMGNNNYSPMVSYEDNLYADMSIDIEDAIDKIRLCRQLAELNYKTPEEMWYEMFSQTEDRTVVELPPITEDEVDDMVAYSEYDSQFE
jgi:hypothetical protein